MLALTHWLRQFGRSTFHTFTGSQRVTSRVQELEPRLVPSLLGNQLFPANNPWNQQITNAPVAANSDTLVNSIGFSKGMHADFGNALYNGAYVGIPFNTVPGSQPKINVVIDAYADESDIQPIPIPTNAIIEGDPLPSAQNTSDRHLIVYDQDHNIVYETFNTHRPSEEPDHQWHADAEAVWDLTQNTFRPPGWTSADAAGLPILPGLARPDEVYDQGKITHALRFTVPKSDNAYIFPASHEAGSNNPAYPRMGERFRLKQSVDISGFPADDRVILQALKDYGMIVADNGSGWYVSGQPSSRWVDSDLAQLGQIPLSDFEAVDLTPVVTGISPSSGGTAGGAQVVISGLNFSGGAGQTQVLFGATPAAGFGINSDGSITATAPAHAAGTVDENVVSPYGTSATRAADQFTYTNHVVSLGSETFVLGLDNQVYAEKFDANDNPMGGYFLTSPGQVKTLTVGHDASGLALVFAIEMDDQVYVQKFNVNGDSTGGDSPTAPGRIQSLSVGWDAGGAPEAFVIGLDDQVWAQHFDASGDSVGGYFLTAVGQVKSLSVGRDAGGAPEAFVIGLDDQVWAQHFDRSGNSVGGYFLTAAGRVESLSVGSDAGNHPEVFVIGLDNQVWAQQFDAAGNSRGGYALTTVGEVKSLSVGRDPNGDPEVFVLGLDDQLWAQKFDANGDSTGGYSLTTTGRVKALSVAHDAANDLVIFAIGLDDQVYAQRFNAAGNSIGPYGFTTGGRVLSVSS
jgi:hypothetical protein